MKKVKMIAHRGFSAIERENTCAAFIAAGNNDFWGIETDIHVTSDGRFIAFHDDNTSRLSTDNYIISKTDYIKLNKIVLRDMSGGYSRSDLRIPTLEEYISICRTYQKHCVVELKTKFNINDIKKIIGIINSYSYLSSVIFISFELQNLKYLRELLPSQPAQLLTGEITEELVKTLAKYNLDAAIRFDKLSKGLCEQLKSKGIVINCWTCNDKNKAEELAYMGVNYITSDIIDII